MKLKGSLTVFLALILGMTLAVVFGFLEAARASGLRANAQMRSMQASDALLSEYQPGLWKDYGVLFWEAEGGNSDTAATWQIHYLEQNSEGIKSIVSVRRYPFIEVEPYLAAVDVYEWSTDHGGEPFRRQAVLAAKTELASDAVDELTEVIAQQKDGAFTEEEIAGLEKDAAAVDRQLEEQAQEASQTEEKLQEAEQPTEPETAEEELLAAEKRRLKKDNPIKWMIRMKKKGILGLVMPDADISEKELDSSALLTKRKLQEGNYGSAKGGAAGDRLWFRLYLQQHFADASRDSKQGALDYEMEYLIAGKMTDADNLKAVVNRLLLMREGANYLYLLQDKEKNEEALLMATAIVSAFGQPELAEPVKHAILLAWAYAESISDVRILLDGGKIAPIKTKNQWKTDLFDLSGEYAGEGADGAEKKTWEGLTYTQYLQLLMLAESDEKVTYRAMDLIEQKEGIQMDHMAARLKCSYAFTAQPLFWRFVILGDQTFGRLTFQTTQELSYLPAD